MSKSENSIYQFIPPIFPIICIILLCVALCKLPYGYYTFLRLTMLIWGIIYGIKHYNISKNGLLTILAFGVAVLYNPIIIVHLNRAHWSIINIITIFIIYVCSIEHRMIKNDNTDIDLNREQHKREAQQIAANQVKNNILQLLDTCIHVKAREHGLFKSTSEKIEALYFVMVMVKKELDFSYDFTKTEPCLHHLAKILSKFSNDKKEVEDYCIIWSKERMDTYNKCSKDEWTKTLYYYCTQAIHNNIAIKGVPEITSIDTTMEARYIKQLELTLWLDSLLQENLFNEIAKSILEYEKYSNSELENKTSIWKKITTYADKHIWPISLGCAVSLVIIVVIIDSCIQKTKTKESYSPEYTIPMKQLEIIHEPPLFSLPSLKNKNSPTIQVEECTRHQEINEYIDSLRKSSMDDSMKLNQIKSPLPQEYSLPKYLQKNSNL